ncbi:hypothetical protein ABE438_11860 [Bosea sp. TWI1241]|uniref:hypothetical protein n=1 Tax=Bosea sp. TWI1241 TaxID=3148904 RepID=UPI003208563A
MMLALERFQALLGKGGFNPDQPRVPAGSREGGQWSGGGSGQPGIGDNGGPPLDPTPSPERKPKEKPTRVQAAKALAREIARQALRRAGPVGAALIAIEAGHQLYAEYPAIRSYQDPPKALDELQAGVGRGRPGYEDHHIVERSAGSREGFSRQEIDGVGNVVSIPKYKHHEITGWYNKRNPNFDFQTPRNYLRGKDWSEHVKIGHQAMRTFGVLK